MIQKFATFFLSDFILQIPSQNEIGPEGHKLVWFAVAIAVAGLLLFLWMNSSRKLKLFHFSLSKRKKIGVSLKKNRSFRPDSVELTIINTGKADLDIDTPLVIFSGMIQKRKFRLKGTSNYRIYPLYLPQGDEHTMNIDLKRFYGFDKSLKKLPRMKVIVFEVGGRRLGSSKILLRKTLFNV
jgi:hypothetical protein